MSETLRLLLLEDSRFDAELLATALHASYPGARLDVVGSQAAFASALDSGTYTLVLSDYELPGYSGADALDHVRRVAPSLPFIFVSGVIGEDNAVEMLKRGATDYVSKSRLSRLPLVIDRALREVAERQARERDARALREAKEQAEQANRAKDRFLAVLSHELRTPLAPIAAAIHVLEQVALVPPEQRHLLPMVRRNVALEARLIDDLLDLTAISAGKLRLQQTAVDAHALLRDVVGMMAHPIGQHRLAVELALEAPCGWVQADEARLQQVLWNLLHNAVKFSPDGGHILMRTEAEGDNLVVTCTDSGVGIAPEDLARIFKPFEQASSDAARPPGGLGLGLAIASELAHMQGGALEVHSDGLGHGARFTLRLRRAVPAPEPLPADVPTGNQVPPGRGEPHHVLLVEDHPDTAGIMVACLELCGYRVTHAGSCADALAAARHTSFDVVLTDLGLPDGTGIDVGRALSPRMPVVVLSGYGSPSDLFASSQAGFAAHLVKPVDMSVMRSTLEQVLARRAVAVPAT